LMWRILVKRRQARASPSGLRATAISF